MLATMNAAADMDPMALLRAMETGCRVAAVGVPDQVERRDVWSGIAFRLGDQQLLAPIGAVIETLSLPQLSMVPNTAGWVRGIANVRGRLLPVIDLHGLLYGEVAKPDNRSRVLVIEFEDIYSGLIVNEVYGLRHFPVAACIVADDRAGTVLEPYVSNGFQVEGIFQGIISIPALSASERFMQTAI
jgi:twitching motility protein PilI